MLVEWFEGPFSDFIVTEKVRTRAARAIGAALNGKISVIHRGNHTHT
jgi:hypothetical protein